MRPLVVGSAVLETTLAALRSAGMKGNEGVVLWLGRRENEQIQIDEAIVPEHVAEADMFQIPRQSIMALIEIAGRKNLIVAAQVHSHPKAAFHSSADDKWAIIRHVGAVSIVIPIFAQRTTVKTFWRDAAIFALSESNTWDEVLSSQLNETIVRVT